MKYEVLRGKHHEGGGDTGMPFITYRVGDIVDTDCNLLALNGRHTPKFALVNSNPSEEDYHLLTLPNLRKYAVERGVELGSAKRKADILQIIEDAFLEEDEELEIETIV